MVIDFISVMKFNVQGEDRLENEKIEKIVALSDQSNLFVFLVFKLYCSWFQLDEDLFNGWK